MYYKLPYGNTPIRKHEDTHAHKYTYEIFSPPPIQWTSCDRVNFHRACAQRERP